ncbi:uncharacterized protein [Rutidosis leptorrhynchoides]|uniref:uncharacterized protein n=1 Tax=Rutidosis leptorrhynchoides TaxID=125765 RepID=UPI003A999221
MENETTAADAWSRLQNVFQDNKNSRALYLHRQFTTIRLDDFPDVSAYCQQIKSLADQLKNIGDKVTYERMVLQLIAGLNDNFDTVGTYFTQLTDLPSFYEARSKLILEETRKQKQAPNHSSSSDTALLVTSSSNKPIASTESTQPVDRSNTGSSYRGNSYRGRGRGNFRGRSNRGRGRGHSTGYQSHNSPYWAAQNPWQFSNQWNHPPCPYPTNNWVRPNSTSSHAGILGPRPNYTTASNASTHCPTDIDSAMHTLTLNHPYDTWYMDTGATSHMSANSGNLNCYYSLRKPKHIIVGNGHGIPIKGFGCSVLPNPSRPLYLQNILHAPNLIKNLISVRRLSIDNNISLEFDPFGFTVKDFP